MKIDEDENIIYTNFEERIKITWSPEILNFNFKNIEENRVIAELISNLKSFDNYLKDIRNKAEIKIINYPKEIKLDDLIKLVFGNLNSNQQEILNNGICEILKIYNLSDCWSLSIRTAIETNVLLIPPNYGSIRFHFPLNKQINENKPKKISEIADNMNNHMERMRLMTETAFYPAIYFTEDMKINKIIDWLKTNKLLIEEQLSKLPKHIKSKTKYSTIFWGQVVWILRQDGIKKWSKISKEAEKLMYSTDDEDCMQVPDEIELRNFYKSYLQQLKNLERNK